MSRATRSQLPADAPADKSADEPLPSDGAKIAEEIGIAALELAGRARAHGLTTVAYLLENVALEAGAEAVARQWAD